MQAQIALCASLIRSRAPRFGSFYTDIVITHALVCDLSYGANGAAAGAVDIPFNFSFPNSRESIERYTKY